jgi:uncharacterized Zn-finger protein
MKLGTTPIRAIGQYLLIATVAVSINNTYSMDYEAGKFYSYLEDNQAPSDEVTSFLTQELGIEHPSAPEEYHPELQATPLNPTPAPSVDSMQQVQEPSTKRARLDEPEQVSDLAEEDTAPQQDKIPASVFLAAAKQVTAQKSLHQAENELFTCEDCHRSFSTEYSLKKHMTLHLKRCTVAGCLFATKWQSSLTAHMKTHSEVRQFKCPVSGCPYAAKTQHCLREHTKKHHLYQGHTGLDQQEQAAAQPRDTAVPQHAQIRAVASEPEEYCPELQTTALNPTPAPSVDSMQQVQEPSTRQAQLDQPEQMSDAKEEDAAPQQDKAPTSVIPAAAKQSLQHMEIALFTCETCGMSFTTQDHLKRHIKTLSF